MALTLNEKYTLSQNATFKAQVAAAMENQAATVLVTPHDPSKPYSRFIKMQTYARAVVQNPAAYVDAFSFASAVKGSFAGTTTATDAEVTTIVTAVFPYLSGIDPTEI